MPISVQFIKFIIFQKHCLVCDPSCDDLQDAGYYTKDESIKIQYIIFTKAERQNKATHKSLFY